MTSIPEFDNSTLLASLLSAGVIGGSLMLVDRTFSERSQWGVVGGVALGILLDYNLKKTTLNNNIVFFQDYLTDLWNDVERRKNIRKKQRLESENYFLSDLVDLTEEETMTKLEEFRNQEQLRTKSLLARKREELAMYQSIQALPKNERHEKLAAFEEHRYQRDLEEEDDFLLKASLNRAEADLRASGMSEPSDSMPRDEYWGNLFSSVVAGASVILITYGLKMTIGYFRSAGLPPEVFQNAPIPLETNILGNPINVIPAPTELQIMSAIPRRGAEILAAKILRDTLEQTGFFSKIRELVTSSVHSGVVAGRELLDPIIDDFEKTYLDNTVRRRENTYLTNENLLLMQNPDGTEAVALLHSFGKGAIAPAAVRVSQEFWDASMKEYANRANITPVEAPMKLEDLELPKNPEDTGKMTIEELNRNHQSDIDQIKIDRSMTLGDLDDPAEGPDTRTKQEILNDIVRKVRITELDKEWKDGHIKTPGTTMSGSNPMQPPSIATTVSNILDIEVHGGGGRTLRQIVRDVAYSGIISYNFDLEQSVLIETILDIDANTLLSSPTAATLNTWYDRKRVERRTIINAPLEEYGGRTLRDIVQTTIREWKPESSRPSLPVIPEFYERTVKIEKTMKTMFTAMMKLPEQMRDGLEAQLELFDAQLETLGGDRYLHLLKKNYDPEASQSTVDLDEDIIQLVPDVPPDVPDGGYDSGTIEASGTISASHNSGALKPGTILEDEFD